MVPHFFPVFRSQLVRLSVVTCGLLACASSCKDEKNGPQGTPPPPAKSVATAPSTGASGSAAKVAGCDPTTVGLADERLGSVLPASVAEFCVTKSTTIQSWGEGTSKKIENITELIDGGGDLYVSNFFVKRFDRINFTAPARPGVEVQIDVSAYERPETAYAFFTYRLVSNADPDPETTKKAGRRPLKEVKAGGVAALGKGNAYLWKGNYVVELTFQPDSNMSEADAIAAGDTVLTKFVEAIGNKIVGSTDMPADVRALPSEADGRIPLGVEYVSPKYLRPKEKSDALKLSISGGFAQAFMKDGDKRYRVIAVQRDDRDAARDAFVVFGKMAGSLPIREFMEDATHFTFPVGDGGASAAGKAEGVVARDGNVIFAVIDEEFALGDPSKKDGYPRLSKDEKIAKIRALFAKKKAPTPVPVPSTSASAPASGSSRPAASTSR